MNPQPPKKWKPGRIVKFPNQPTAEPTRECTECARDLPLNRYSKRQRHEEYPRCQDCVSGSLAAIDAQREERAAAQSLEWQSQKLPKYSYRGRSSPTKWAGGEFVAESWVEKAVSPIPPSAPPVKPAETQKQPEEPVIPPAREVPIFTPRRVELNRESPQKKNAIEGPWRPPMIQPPTESGRQSPEKKQGMESNWRKNLKPPTAPHLKTPKTTNPPMDAIRIRLPRMESESTQIEAFVPSLRGYKNHKTFGIDLMVWFRAIAAATSALLTLQNPPWSIQNCDYPQPRDEGEIVEESGGGDKASEAAEVVGKVNEEREVRNRSRQLQEIYVLKHMFLEGEFEEISNGITQAAEAFSNDDSDRFARELMISGVAPGFRIRLLKSALDCENGEFFDRLEPCYLRYKLPTNYPEQVPECRLECGIEFPQVSMHVNKAIADFLPTVSVDDTGQLEHCLFELFQVAKEALQSFVNGQPKLAAAEGGTVESGGVEGGEGMEEEVVEEVEAGRLLLWSHHIKNVNKRKTILELASELELGVLSKVGEPGFILVEGENDRVQEYETRIKSLRWQAIRNRAEEYNVLPVEEKTKRGAQKALDGWRMMKDGNGKVASVEVDSMSGFTER
ncbi:RWD domain-containing protein 2B [Rhizophlyctis rosea]|uniref:RWD domain-containing protein 2B n=1 Tax=Rhizophlyctis rosea TaxID=64517 RepID=A0AAD5X2I0_9FUNG|nr:RWD domain-containing protein 2B [Rhizophlyctis rosea]